jgi:hypothetical protein
MKFTETEFNNLIKEAINETINRLIKEYQEERQPSSQDIFFEGDKMNQVRTWLERCGWELADMFNQLMVLPNAIALIALSGLVVASAKNKDK